MWLASVESIPHADTLDIREFDPYFVFPRFPIWRRNSIRSVATYQLIKIFYLLTYSFYGTTYTRAGFHMKERVEFIGSSLSPAGSIESTLERRGSILLILAKSLSVVVIIIASLIIRSSG